MQTKPFCFYLNKDSVGDLNKTYNPAGRMVNTKKPKEYYSWAVYIKRMTRSKGSGDLQSDHCTGGIITASM